VACPADRGSTHPFHPDRAFGNNGTADVAPRPNRAKHGVGDGAWDTTRPSAFGVNREGPPTGEGIY